MIRGRLRGPQAIQARLQPPARLPPALRFLAEPQPVRALDRLCACVAYYTLVSKSELRLLLVMRPARAIRMSPRCAIAIQTGRHACYLSQDQMDPRTQRTHQGGICVSADTNIALEED